MQEKYDNNTTLAVDRKPDPDFLPFTNDFIFSLVMRDPTLCRELLALALPEGKRQTMRTKKTDRQPARADCLS